MICSSFQIGTPPYTKQNELAKNLPKGIELPSNCCRFRFGHCDSGTQGALGRTRTDFSQ